MKIRKAVIAAAGLGTRVLPASKAVPKEMLPIIDKPAIQYIVEEAVQSGIEDILIITNRGKSVMEDHFDRSPELEERLLAGGKTKEYDEIVSISRLANIFYIRQKEIKGLGHAVYCARSFVGDEPFAVLYGDDVIIGENPCTKQLVDAYEEFGLGAVCMKEVPDELVMKYSSLATTQVRNNLYRISDMIEKPKKEQILSNYSILGRCVLPAKIFDILKNTAPGANNEIQLTDAMRTLAVTDGMTGVDFEGIRYDMGNKLGILKAIVEVGLTHAEVGEDFRAYLKEMSDKI